MTTKTSEQQLNAAMPVDSTGEPAQRNGMKYLEAVREVFSVTSALGQQPNMGAK